MKNEPIAEAIKYAAFANDLILIGELCKLLKNPCTDRFNRISQRLHSVSDTLAVQDLRDWVASANRT